jgi:hypothetical protein
MMNTRLPVLSRSQRMARPLEDQISTECMVDRTLPSSREGVATPGGGRP